MIYPTIRLFVTSSFNPIAVHRNSSLIWTRPFFRLLPCLWSLATKYQCQITHHTLGSDLVTLAQGLALVHVLRRLALGFIDATSFAESFYQALQQSVEDHNTTLCKLSMMGLPVIAKRYLLRIRYLLATNLVGRHTLMTAPNLPIGLWAYVLARSSKTVDGIYFALTEMPDIILL